MLLTQHLPAQHLPWGPALRLPRLWTRVTRTVRPVSGARANAAEALLTARHSRRERAEADAQAHAADRAEAGRASAR